MNLIEKCGGYDKAKQMYESQLKAGLAPYGYEESLLQHRREHNIYEVGDLVVGLTSETDGIFKIKTTSNKLKRNGEKSYAVTFVGKEGLLVGLQYRHATPEEIEAGHRL